MEPLATTASKGIERLFDYGVAVTVLCLTLLACGFLVRHLLQRCDMRFAESLQSHRELTEKVSEVLNRNTIVISQVLENLRK